MNLFGGQKYKWETNFNGSSLPSTIWHVGELWWYGLAEAFWYNCDADYRKEDASIFWIEGKSRGPNAFIGVTFPWCRKDFHGSWIHRPAYFLEQGFIYKFVIGMDEKPDLVLINKKVVWKQEDGKFTDKYVEFYYVPEAAKEEIDICILKKLNSGNTDNRLVFSRVPYFKRPKMRCFRARYDKTEIPAYGEFVFPAETVFAKIDKEVANSRLEKYNSLPVDYSFPELRKVPYATSEMKFIFNANETNKRRLTYFLSYARKSGFDIFDLQHAALKKGGAGKLIEKLKKAGLDIMFYPSIRKEGDKYISNHWVRFMGQGKPVAAERGTIDLIKECLSINPDFKLYLMYPEFSSIFGHWAGGVVNSPMQSRPGLKKIISGGGTKAYEAICDYWLKVTNRIKKSVPEGTVKVIALYSGSIHGALLARVGADVLMNKHIHRRSQNIVVANTRGTANAYDLEYGFDNDCWNRCYVCDYSPDEVRQNLNVYYFSGGQYLYSEMLTAAYEKNALTAVGRELVEFVRYCKTHPVLGRQKVKIAVMRGLPDEWNRFAAPSASWEAAKDGNEVTYHKYFEDYNLLNLVFPNFGLFYRTFTDRLCTGTPYGPVDFVPWDISPEKLKDYEVVIFLGKSNCMTDSIYGNLKKYVEKGGTLFAALGHFKDKNGKLIKKDFSDFLGVTALGDFTMKADPVWDRGDTGAWLLPEDKVKYPVIKPAVNSAETVYRFKNSDPQVVKNVIGKGRVFLFAGDYLTEYGNFTPARMIQPALGEVKWLDFSPVSDWLEYIVQKKGECYILPVFNHGNVGFPSGNGRKTGPWQGKISLDLDKFAFPPGKLAVYESVYVPDEKIPFKLISVKASRENGRLVFTAKIDKFSEFIVGPEGKIQNTYFNSPKNNIE